MAVERLKRCENIVALSEELGVHRRLLYKWRDQLDPVDSSAEPPPENPRASTLRKEVSQLKRRLADITYIRLHREFVYLAVILDAYSRKVVGWELDRTLAARLPIAALGNRIELRLRFGWRWHCDGAARWEPIHCRTGSPRAQRLDYLRRKSA